MHSSPDVVFPKAIEEEEMLGVTPSRRVVLIGL